MPKYQESAILYAESIEDNDYTIEIAAAFEKGYELCQKEYEEKLRWIQIKYTKGGYISEETKNEMIKSIPFILRYDNGFIKVIENKNDIIDFSGAFNFRSVFL